MKKQLTKLLTAGVVLAMALALAACGGSGGDSAEEVLARAQEAFDDVTSMHYTMDMDMGFSADGESIEINTNAEADCISDPIAIDMDMTMDMMGLFDMTFKMYIVQDGDQYIVYTGMDDGDGNYSWSKEVMDDMGDMKQYNGSSSMAIYMENGAEFKEAGTEEINGSTATRYDGVITQEGLQTVMETSGVLDQYESLGIEGMDELLSEMGDLPVSIWIDNKSGMPVNYEMDMTAMIQNLMTKLMAEDPETAETDFTVDKCYMVMICSDFNTIDSIEVPEEALNASSSDEWLDDFLSDEEGDLLDEPAEDAA